MFHSTFDQIIGRRFKQNFSLSIWLYQFIFQSRSYIFRVAIAMQMRAPDKPAPGFGATADTLLCGPTPVTDTSNSGNANTVVKSFRSYPTGWPGNVRRFRKFYVVVDFRIRLNRLAVGERRFRDFSSAGAEYT